MRLNLCLNIEVSSAFNYGIYSETFVFAVCIPSYLQIILPICTITNIVSTTPFSSGSYWKKNTKLPGCECLATTMSPGNLTARSRRLVISSLLLSGGLELNPGPDSVPSLCGHCGYEVRDTDAGVAYATLATSGSTAVV